ncbi:MAG: VOC family protein [Desulfobacca sp.]|nr:VOC family protein [Desulfobacca sp.]
MFRGDKFFQVRRFELICHVHHVHLFAADVNKSIEFYTTGFGGKVVADLEMAGARNVFIRIGKGRVHLYDQPPKHRVRGNIHHFGIQTDDLEGVVERLKSKGVTFQKGIADFGFWKYIMVPAPDEVLIELFQVDTAQLPNELVDYFE